MMDSKLTDADWAWIGVQEGRGLWPLWSPAPDGGEIVEFWSSWISLRPDFVLERDAGGRYAVRDGDGRLAGRGRSAADAFLRARSIALVG